MQTFSVTRVWSYAHSQLYHFVVEHTMLILYLVFFSVAQSNFSACSDIIDITDIITIPNAECLSPFIIPLSLLLVDSSSYPNNCILFQRHLKVVGWESATILGIRHPDKDRSYRADHLGNPLCKARVLVVCFQWTFQARRLKNHRHSLCLQRTCG